MQEMKNNIPLRNNYYLLFLLPATFLLHSCDFLFGTRKDATVDEIFDEGAIDPDVIQDVVGYVPVLPFWGNLSHPVDVYCGYDEMIYVVDDNGVEVLDQTGNIRNTIPVQGATDVTEDRSLNLYVAGRTDIDVDGDGIPENLAAIYKLSGTASGQVQFLDTLIQPFCDASRTITAFRGADDEAVQFTGLATLANNTLYVARTGPRNDLTGIARPDNTVLFFDAAGNNIGYANGLSPLTSNLKSLWDISSLATFAAPPQSLSGFSASPDFLVTLTAEDAEYKCLWMVENIDPESGASFGENDQLTAFDYTKAQRFLYEPYRFTDPEDVYIAPDFTGYIFVVDAARDSLYQFTRKGYEGVNPPPGSGITMQVIASFGGSGSGPFQFQQPHGVAYLRNVVYVADTGNNRICRYELSSDIE